MLKGIKISVVIPCKDEENSIARTINSIPKYVDEIIVVDNGSSDRTVSQALKTKAKVLKENRKLNGIGYGYAILRGLREAQGDYIFTIDADGSHPANEIAKILDYAIENKIDVVSCSRLPLSSIESISQFRKIGIYVLNIQAYLLFGIKIQDMLSGMFCIKRTALSRMNLKMGDWNLSPEVKISAATNKNISFAEYPISQIPRKAGESKQVVWTTGKTHVAYILNRKMEQLSVLLNSYRLPLSFKRV